jgi:hypothetical protein
MKSRRFKSILAVVLSVAMVMGTSVFAMAGPEQQGENLVVSGNDVVSEEQGKVTASGQMEGWVEKDVFKVTIPVSTSANDTLAFVMDPQNLIYSTGGIAKGWDKTSLVQSTLYFTQSGNAAHAVAANQDKYSNVSNTLSVNNLSSVSVDVALKVKMNDIGNITLSTNNSFKTDTNDKTPKLYMGMTVLKGNKDNMGSPLPGTPMALTAEDAVSKNMLANIPGHNNAPDATHYGLSYNGTTYTYELGEDYVMGSAANTILKFYFTGETNPNADWKAINDANTAPKLSVIWDVKKHSDDVTVEFSRTTLKPAQNTITLTPSTGISITSATLTKPNGSKVNCTAGNQYTYSNGVITFDSTVITNNAGGSVKFVLSNEQEQVVTLSK